MAETKKAIIANIEEIYKFADKNEIVEFSPISNLGVALNSSAIME